MMRIALLTFMLLFSTKLLCEEAYPNFEAELRAIETNQLKEEKLYSRPADAVTDVISDEVTSAQAAATRDESYVDISQKEAEKSKTRKVRSR